MQKNLFIYTVLAGLLALQTSYAAEPKNLDFVKAALIQYHDSGAYQKDQAAVVDQAMQYLKTRLDIAKKTHDEKKLAVVFDIDETSLSNYPDMVRMDFGGLSEEVCAAEGNGKDPAIAPTLELYRYAKANNVTIFFITGRTEQYRAATEKNLKAVGFDSWTGLTLKPENDHDKMSTYKTGARALIEKQGYDIVLNIGDQKSDLAGGFADKTFKMPNPYYFTA